MLVGLLTFINIRGVRAGAQVSNLFTAAKLVPLFAVIVLGLFVLLQPPLDHRNRVRHVPQHQPVDESRAASGLRLRRIRDRAGAHERSEKSSP